MTMWPSPSTWKKCWPAFGPWFAVPRATHRMRSSLVRCGSTRHPARGRLSAGWLVLALVATGFLLTDLYSRALDTSLTETLEFHVESLAGTLLESADPLSDNIRLNDPRFDRPRSGWYWAVRDDAGKLYNLS